MTKFLVGILMMIAGAASAGAGNDGVSESITFTPCSFWSYNSTVNGYVCNNTGFSERVPDLYEFNELERRVDDLERRLRDLETKLEAALQR